MKKTILTLVSFACFYLFTSCNDSLQYIKKNDAKSQDRTNQVYLLKDFIPTMDDSIFTPNKVIKERILTEVNKERNKFSTRSKGNGNFAILPTIELNGQHDISTRSNNEPLFINTTEQVFYYIEENGKIVDIGVASYYKSPVNMTPDARKQWEDAQKEWDDAIFEVFGQEGVDELARRRERFLKEGLWVVDGFYEEHGFKKNIEEITYALAKADEGKIFKIALGSYKTGYYVNGVPYVFHISNNFDQTEVKLEDYIKRYYSHK